jgi:hypothetical protein
MAFDARTFVEEWLARMNAEKDVLEARREHDELLLEEIDIQREAAQEWLDDHPA